MLCVAIEKLAEAGRPGSNSLHRGWVLLPSNTPFPVVQGDRAGECRTAKLPFGLLFHLRKPQSGLIRKVQRHYRLAVNVRENTSHSWEASASHSFLRCFCHSLSSYCINKTISSSTVPACSGKLGDRSLVLAKRRRSPMELSFLHTHCRISTLKSTIFLLIRL